MNKAAVFFDLDGTICDIKRGMPDDTKEAIHRLRANGHKAFLCTGRSRAYLPKELSALNLDGMVAACGAYMEYQGHCIYNERMSAPVAKKTVEILRANGLVPVMEGWDYLYYDKEEYHSGIDWYADLITEQLDGRWRPIRNNENMMDINKVSAKRTAGRFDATDS
ncbi:HAD-IIB family hydrolase [Diplocloster modestus]|uniref:HAD-IIB family hydrolase n=1 Tax=Diplocloster modestus TaxID=2850322 RepID=A0ABS6K9N3_9FIRM|nr:HAD-IIB family hydrolase [Diplocloster modestus]MBU9727221.1 HAD-IIB family hydrolase [Diplocloster modestus]